MKCICGPCITMDMDDDHTKSDISGSTVTSDVSTREEVASAKIIQIWWKKMIKNKLYTHDINLQV